MDGFKNDIYAGVLGKIIGVYLGRPVEGWPYEKIQEEFGEIYYYKNHKTGAPLIVPDDDISGTFGFFRSLEDHGYDPGLSSAQVGDSWLNYIIEDQTILWWGGLSRSTEHTAYLRLKNGIKAPESGSMARNGRSMAEQVGAEIFIDAWALANPGNPERAARMAREAARVSHDGIGVEAAVYLAAMEAMAFVEKDLDKLLDQGLGYVKGSLLPALVKDVRDQCAKAAHWRQVRQWIACNHGYEKYPGNCPMVTNHLAVIMALAMGGDDFNKACMIASSAGWDTDCNAGNVGCLNGIRLGLPGLGKGPDLRKAVADRLYVVTSDGGSCISDAVQEARKIWKAACALEGEEAALPLERLAFEYPGSVQGVVPYDQDLEEQVLVGIKNWHEEAGEFGLKLSFEGLAAGLHASVSMDTFVDLQPKGKEGTSYFDVLCSPILYSGQQVVAKVLAPMEANPDFCFFMVYFNEKDEQETWFAGPVALCQGENVVKWIIPQTGGHGIYRLGIRLESQRRLDGFIVLKSLDWSNVPEVFRMEGAMDMTPSLTPWTTTTSWLKTFVSSADHFCPDYTTTFSISHKEENGVVTTGTLDWDDYSVKSQITFSQQEGAGLVVRAKGHRQYYGGVLVGKKAVIYRQAGGERIPVAWGDYDFNMDETHVLELAAWGTRLSLSIDGKLAAEGDDKAYQKGGAGFVVDAGAVLAEGFEVRRMEEMAHGRRKI